MKYIIQLSVMSIRKKQRKKRENHQIFLKSCIDKRAQYRLIGLIQGWGFIDYGIKKTVSGEEMVYVRDFSRAYDSTSPKKTYPFFSKNSRIFLVSIYPEYHTNLFPDSILRTESPHNFIENEPFRNAISKVFISRSIERNLKSGDIIIFYRTKSGGPAYHTAVITTIGIVEKVITNIKDENHFISLCRKRSVFDDQELAKHWNYSTNRPFIVNFLYTYSFPKRINLNKLIEIKVIADINSAPRGFDLISNESFKKIIKETNSDESIIIN